MTMIVRNPIYVYVFIINFNWCLHSFKMHRGLLVQMFSYLQVSRTSLVWIYFSHKYVLSSHVFDIFSQAYRFHLNGCFVFKRSITWGNTSWFFSALRFLPWEVGFLVIKPHFEIGIHSSSVPCDHGGPKSKIQYRLLITINCLSTGRSEKLKTIDLPVWQIKELSFRRTLIFSVPFGNSLILES